MVEQLTRQQIARHAEIHARIPGIGHNRREVDRTFELPTALYAATVGLFLGFIAVMGWGFANPEMALPLAIFALFVVAGFGLPTLWTRLAPGNGSHALGWERFRRDGIMTAYGRVSARDASVQVLILPVLIFFWGVSAVTIAALV